MNYKLLVCDLSSHQHNWDIKGYLYLWSATIFHIILPYLWWKATLLGKWATPFSSNVISQLSDLNQFNQIIENQMEIIWKRKSTWFLFFLLQGLRACDMSELEYFAAEKLLIFFQRICSFYDTGQSTRRQELHTKLTHTINLHSSWML